MKYQKTELKNLKCNRDCILLWTILKKDPCQSRMDLAESLKLIKSYEGSCVIRLLRILVKFRCIEILPQTRTVQSSHRIGYGQSTRQIISEPVIISP